MERICTITLENGDKAEVTVIYEYIKETIHTDSYILDDVETDDFEIISISNPNYQDIIDSDFDEFKNEVSEHL